MLTGVLHLLIHENLKVLGKDGIRHSRNNAGFRKCNNIEIDHFTFLSKMYSSMSYISVSKEVG